MSYQYQDTDYFYFSSSHLVVAAAQLRDCYRVIDVPHSNSRTEESFKQLAIALKKYLDFDEIFMNSPEENPSVLQIWADCIDYICLLETFSFNTFEGFIR